MNTSEERPEVEQNSRGKAEMVWTFAEKGWWIYWTKDAKYGAAKQEMEKKKTMVVVVNDMKRTSVTEQDTSDRVKWSHPYQVRH